MSRNDRPVDVFAGLFASNPDFDFDVRLAVGRAGAGAADPGEVLAAVRDVEAKDHEGWFDAWRGLGERSRANADTAAAAGHDVTAAAAYLRASSYFGQAVNAVSGLADESALVPTFRAGRDAWDRFVDLTATPVQSLDIPYEGGTLPAYFFHAGHGNGETHHPTLVLNLGSDESLAAAWASAGPDALARGYHVLLFEGPGQQSMLFDRDIPFRNDWESVLTPVVDALMAEPVVHPDRIAVWGFSQAGYWVSRALAYEHRFAAAVVDPGVVDVSTSWLEHLPKSLIKLIEKGEHHKFDRDMAFGMKFSGDLENTWRFRARPYGGDDYADVVTEVLKYRLTDQEASAITTPLLITSPEHEQFWPGQSERLAALTPQVSTVLPFSAAEGGDMHCEPLAHALLTARVFDWLDEVLDGELPAKP